MSPDNIIATTPRLIIRSITVDDLPVLYERIFGDEEVMRYISSGVSPDIEHAAQRVQKYIGWEKRFGMSFWAVILKSTGELIGNCGLIPVEGHGPEVEIGYDTAQAFWRQGYTSEAAAACLKVGFDTLHLKRIIAICDPLNTGSWKVMEKIGMHKAGTTDKFYGMHCLLYDITAEQFAESKSSPSP
ncbi:GNAT family N-acetyltransferase [bacterium]|nr:GNAT family N-acetyltransferase [bacterium]